MKQGRKYLLILITLLAPHGLQAQPAETGTSGSIKAWSDLEKRNGFHFELHYRDYLLFYTEAANSLGNYRTVGASGPFFVLGPLERTGLIKDLYAGNFTVSGTYGEETGLKADRDTLSDKYPGLALMLPRGDAGIWLQNGEEKTGGGLWFRLGRNTPVYWESALTGTSRKDSECPSDWYPERWNHPTGIVAGISTRVVYSRGSLLGGLTILGGFGESIKPGIRGEGFIRWKKGRNLLLFHGGLTLPGFRNADGEIRKTMADTSAKVRCALNRRITLSAGGNFTCDEKSLPVINGSLGFQLSTKPFRLASNWYCRHDFDSQVTGLTGDLSAWTDWNTVRIGMTLKGAWPADLPAVYTVNPAMILTYRQITLTTDFIWITEKAEELSISGKVSFEEGFLTAGIGLGWVFFSDQTFPDMDLTVKVRF